MKIGNPPEKPVATPATATTARNPADGTAAAPQAAEASAQVELSNTAANLLSGANSAAGEFDAAKVERISRAIGQGEFTVNAEVIADKLIANAAEVLNNGASKS
ncbi:MAG: flagellar biosynthesis anti-sigma factor FlgM [Pseudomonadota bacterium]|nr:flagellar biosynthesis anti-sigma factor FlgM [Pseudomonadota bacterium]